MKLYHASTHPGLAEAGVGFEFVLHPGPQGAEGRGVYFSEGLPRVQAADAVAAGKPLTGIVAIPVPLCTQGWWRTKAGLARKHGRPRTWHTQGQSLRLRVLRVEDGAEGRILHCQVLEMFKEVQE